MKITIPKGKNTKQAMEMLGDFLSKYSECELKGNMTVYLSMKTYDDNSFNEEEIVLDDSKRASLEEEAKEHILEYIKSRSQEIHNAPQEKMNAEANYKKAVDNNWSTVNDWKIKVSYYSEQMKHYLTYKKQLDFIKKCFEEDNYYPVQVEQKYKNNKKAYYIAFNGTGSPEKELYLYSDGIKNTKYGKWFYY